jgi:YHS domain-containing protein
MRVTDSKQTMKKLKIPIVAILLTACAAAPFAGFAADSKDAKLKPYPLQTCVVSGEKLGEMGEPFVYEYQGREIKFCCKSCLKDFNKDSAKYIKKIEEAEAKAKK